MRKYLVVLFIVLLTSCYEDKGNYDYSSIKEIEIVADSFELISRVKMGSRLTIKSTINFNGFNEKDLEYKWEFAVQNKTNPVYHLISTDKDFDQEVVIAPANYDVIYTVTNNKTGLSKYVKLNVEVTDAISKYTLMLLCKVPGKENEFDMSSAHEFSALGEPTRNLYSNANKKNIVGAKKLFYFGTYSSPYFDIMGVLKENGGEQLSAFDLSWQNDEADWFFDPLNGVTPDEFLLCDEFKRILWICDGGVYACDTRYKPYKAGLRQEMSDGSPYEVDGVVTFYNSSKYARYIFWDKKGKRFIQWENSARQLQPLAASSVCDVNNIGDMTPVYLGPSSKSRAYAIMKDASGKLHKYVFGDDRSSWPYKLSVTEYSVMSEDLEFDKASAIYPSRAIDALYYAVGDKIWLLNTIVDKRTLFYDFNDPSVKTVEMFHKDGYQYLFFVALNRGNVGSVYRFWIQANGYLQEDMEKLFPKPKNPMTVPYEEMGPYDEIVDMQYKSKSW